MTRMFAGLIVAALAAAPAAASTYSAKLAAPVTDRFITRNIVWNCGPDACLGDTEKSRPLVLCQSIARRAGRVEAFTVDGKALGASELDRCNAVAPDRTEAELANAR